MDAQELQRLKDALEVGHDAAYEVAQNFHEAMKGYRANDHKQVDANVAEIQACITLVEGMLAERAVSPTESVQSIGSHAGFWQVVSNWAYSDEGDQMKEKARRMVTFVDSQIAKERASAHAEGRRSAMEELHPQWLKEKERADRAEAWRIAVEDACMVACIGWTDDPRETINKLIAWHCQIALDPRVSSEAAALAARQAPDLSDNQIMALWTQCNMPSEENDFITGPLPFARALLAQPLQQEGGKETLANGWPKDFHEVVKGAEDVAHQQGRAAAVEEAIRACEAIAQDHRDQYKGRGNYAADNPRRADPHADGCFDGASECADAIRAISSQPSDNLQQASTAQEKPASATDAGLRLRGKASPEFLAEFAAAQATPEGGIKRCTPAIIGGIASMLDSPKGSYVLYADHCAALAASQQAAEPVYQVKSSFSDTWVDMEKEQAALYEKADMGYEVRILYRAAPPQEVDTNGLPG